MHYPLHTMHCTLHTVRNAVYTACMSALCLHMLQFKLTLYIANLFCYTVAYHAASGCLFRETHRRRAEVHEAASKPSQGEDRQRPNTGDESRIRSLLGSSPLRCFWRAELPEVSFYSGKYHQLTSKISTRD